MTTPDEQTVERVATAIQDAHKIYGRSFTHMAHAAIEAMHDTKALQAADALADADEYEAFNKEPTT